MNRLRDRSAHISRALVAAFWFFGSAAHGQSTSYVFNQVDFPGTPNTTGVLGLNNRGDFVGQSSFDGVNVFAYVAVSQPDGTLKWTILPATADGSPIFPTGINDSGTIVGSDLVLNPPYTTYSSVTHPILNSSLTGTQLWGINAAGVMTGNAFNIDGSGNRINSVGFVYDPANICFQSLTGFTDFTFPNGAPARSQGINSACQIVGEYYPNYPRLRGSAVFVRDPNTGLNSYFQVSGYQTRGRGINDAGQIVGFDLDGLGLGTWAGYIGTFSGSFQLLQFIRVPNFDPTIWDSGANGINNSGQVSVGVNNEDDGTFRAFIGTPVNTTALSAGSNVTVNAGTIGTTSISLTFASVSSGMATVMPIVPASGAGALPSGYELSGSNLAFEIATTATYSTPIVIEFTVPYLDSTTFANLQVLHGSPLVPVTVPCPAGVLPQTICASVPSLSPFVLATAINEAQVLQPINSDGSSVFNVSRGVVPVRFALTYGGIATCQLPAAIISLARTAGAVLGSIDESTYLQASDSGSSFRVSGCQYAYNLAASSLGVGTYRADIIIGGASVGSAVFALR